MEGLNLVSGLEVGFGGVWIGAAPYLLFVPVKDGEDKPAGKPQVLLDGWAYQDTHETLNTFSWGPDGWLYGCHGVFTHSRVGKPGTPDAQRVPINAGVWRYPPTRHVFEVLGHAHCGTMIYLGGTWPEEYRGRMFMGNIHGRRLNVDVLKRKGSGYVASHSPDFLLANDAWARFINFRYGPDGNVFLIDWYDQQACHTGNPQVWDRSNGRVYKISYRGTKPVQVDLSKKTTEQLARLQIHENDWYVRHARRLLHERGAN